MEAGGASDPLPTDTFERGVTEALYGMLFSNLATEMPAAVVEVLASVADRNGVIDTVRAQQRLGVKAQRLLATVGTRVPDATQIESTTMTLLTPQTRGLVARSAPPSVTAGRQVLTDVSSALRGGVSLARFRCFGIGEVQPQTQAFLQSLGAVGLPAARTHWLTDPRRSHAVEVERLRSRGVDVMPASDDSGIHTASIALGLQTLFADAKPEETKARFLIVDEDGRITREIHRLYPQFEHLCAIVDQRAASSDFADLTNLRARVISLSDTTVEPMRDAIAGERAVAAIEAALRRADPMHRFNPKEAVVEGYSPESRAIIASLQRRGFTVSIASTDAAEIAAARDAGLGAGDLTSQLSHAHLLVTTVGKLSINMVALQGMPSGAVLASATPVLLDGPVRLPSPRDLNLSRDDNGVLRSTFQGRPIELGRTGDAFQHSVFHISAGDDRLLLRSGVDVSLDTVVPDTFAQVEGGLLLAGVFEAVRTTTAGARTLSAASATVVRDRATVRLKALGLDPLRPILR
jgi:hypothetical protein